jgi:glyceraldehyde-3-phosphate dehydrogenase (NAD(P))
MKVLVNGIGNIGTTLLHFLCKYQEELEIEQIYALKNKAYPWNTVELDALQKKGIILCGKDKDYGFSAVEDCLPIVDYIFDTNANGIATENKSIYENLPNLKGCSAQGSEKNFGLPFMSRMKKNIGTHTKFLTIVSCNTHALCSLLHGFSGGNFAEIKDADFVIVRRSEDIGNHNRLVTSSVVARHLSEEYGTHHAIDVIDLLKTHGYFLPIQSSDVTTPSQLMHAVRFSIQFKKESSKEKLIAQSKKSAFISTTQKFDSNLIFELGRKYGFLGRIYSHSIIIENNLLLDNNNNLKGWAFIPQEGNTILSTIEGFLLQMKHNNASAIMEKIISENISKEW